MAAACSPIIRIVPIRIDRSLQPGGAAGADVSWGEEHNKRGSDGQSFGEMRAEPLIESTRTIDDLVPDAGDV